MPTERPRFLAKLVPNFADRGFHVVSVTDLGFLDRIETIQITYEYKKGAKYILSITFGLFLLLFISSANESVGIVPSRTKATELDFFGNNL
jgi:hypothetical protein